MNQENQCLDQSDQTWLIFFLFVTWIVLITFLWNQDLTKMVEQVVKKQELKQLQKEKKTSYAVTLVETPDQVSIKKKEPSKFLSTKNSRAQGKLFKKKGFEYKDKKLENKFQLNKTTKSKKVASKKSDKILTAEDGRQVHLERKDQSRSSENERSRSALTKIPTNYLFRERKAFRWDLKGPPQLPTEEYKHFKYINRMLQKWRRNVVITGQASAHYRASASNLDSMWVPGSVGFNMLKRPYVNMVWMMDELGNVIDVKITTSSGDQGLDLDLSQAVWDSNSFGKPHEDLLKNDRFIFPVQIRLVP